MPCSTALPKRAYVLDALRGVAALVVVFWHWQHFFFDGASPAPLIREAQPFYPALAWLYRHGDLAVELFFALSGFVFFWLFATRIQRGGVTLRGYVVDRFSRLYPLHLATFLAVAALQGLYMTQHAAPFVYIHQDPYHAALNLALVPAWGFEAGWSFNAPVWSVSVEVLMYALFFVVCRFAYRYALWLSLALLAGGVLLLDANYKIASGLIAFFAGGLSYRLWYRTMAARPGVRRRLLVGLAAATLTGWALWARTPGLHYGSPYGLYYAALISLGAGSVIFWLAVAQAHRPTLGRRLAWLGDISFSVYLWHFPLQLVAVLVTDTLGLPRELYYANTSLLGFMLALVALAAASHRYLERPWKLRLRAMLKDGAMLRATR